MSGIARLQLTAFDCPDPDSLAEFYSAITGWPVGDRGGDWVELDAGPGATLAFQRVEEFRPPEWPGAQMPQQLHCDFAVADLDEGERRVLDLGARKTGFQPSPDDFRVYLDPVGHPFCLVLEKD